MAPIQTAFLPGEYEMLAMISVKQSLPDATGSALRYEDSASRLRSFELVRKL